MPTRDWDGKASSQYLMRNQSLWVLGGWERSGQAGWLGPSKTGSKDTAGEAAFTSSSGDVRASSVTRKGTARQGAMRNRSESGQVVRESFVSGPIAVTQRVNGCYCASARTSDSGGLRKGVSQRKDAERRDKMSIRLGRTRSRGRTRENLLKPRRW